MAETTLQGIWTQKGLDKETAFRAGGERKKLTHVAVGDGNGSLPIVSAAQTSLVHEVWRGLANAVMVNPDDPTDLLVDAVIPNSVGGFWIREWGIFDEDGDLVAVGPHDEMHKPLISTGQAAEFLERFHLPSANATFVEIKIASQALATQQYVEREVAAHNKDSGAHETLARKSVQIKAGTGLSGGGTLEADRTLEVEYGNTAGTACQGNDRRLSDDRTPKAHKATHKAGGSDALLPEEIGAARGNRISATTPATAGWYRIAQSATSISNCMGLFEITGAVSGAHSVSLIAAGLSYGKALNLIQLAHAPWSDPALTKARIVYHPIYSGNFAYLEVYLSQAKAISIGVNLFGGQGWTLVAPSTPGAVPSGYSVKEITLAEGKIVANVNGSISGNAGTATKLLTARTIALSGDVTASGTFDGSGNLPLTATLKNSGATAGSYGPTANATPAFNATFSVPQITVDAKGRVTSAVTRTVKIPANPVATQRANGLLSAADKKALDYGEAFRLSMIGVPRFWRSTTLPAGHVWANGDLALFADWPELKKVYDAGGFNGMLLAYNANAATIAANLGKWRPNAANPTGLYVPKLGDQFFRGWTGGAGAGAWQADALQNHEHDIPTSTGMSGTRPVLLDDLGKVTEPNNVLEAGRFYTYAFGPTGRRADETRPVNVALPVVLYLGLSA